MAILGRGERVVHRVPVLFLLVVLEHREIHHPQRLPAASRVAFLMADFHAQRAERVVHDLDLPGAEEHQAAVFRAGAIDDRAQRNVRKILHDRRLHAFAPFGDVVELDPGQPLRAVDADELGVSVDLAAREIASLGNQESGHTVRRRVRRPGEHLELHRLHHLGELGELQGHAQVGLVRAVIARRVAVAHHRERVGERDA